MMPTSQAQMLDVIGQFGRRARVLAGGTDLVPSMHKGKLDANVVALVSLRQSSLNYIRKDTEGLVIGSATTHTDVATSALVRAEAAALATGSGAVGSLQIRNVATIGGNLCTAGPSADTSAPLTALDARLIAASKRGTRVIPITQWYLGPSRNCLEPDEALIEIVVPTLPPFTGTHYRKFSPRSYMDLAWVGVAVVVTLDKSLKLCEDVRIGLSAVSPSPMRAVKAEAVVRGREITDGLLDKMAETASEECNPNPRSRRVPAWYRRDMVRVLTKRGFNEARRLAAAGR
jgi:carbon-monoxide dehydrogenase medium subunit